MTEILHWLRVGDDVPGMESDARWAWVTIGISAVVALGYVAIASKMIVQSRVAGRREWSAPLARLGAMVALCGAAACWFVFSDMSWPVWRMYDGVLLAVALYACWYALHMRGWKVVDERLARVNALEQSAHRYRNLAIDKEALARHKTFLLNALSHDLRAPLNIVALNAQMIEGAAQEPQQAESAKVIAENAMAAGELVTKLLEVARAGGQDPNALAPVSVALLVEQVARRFQPAADLKGLSLKLSTDGDVRLVTDRQKLERFVGNLLDNAIKYTDHGGVSIETARVGEQIRIRVCDTGPGVPPESIAHVFDEFFQANGTGRTSDEGFGMGLAICRDLARQLGGEVRLASTGPEGSCFEISLAAQRPPRATRPEEPPGRRAELRDIGFEAPELDPPLNPAGRR